MPNDEIKKMEEAGIAVTVTDSEGKIAYQTNLNKSEDVCDACRYLRILPDPDPFDWFCDDDERAYCQKEEKNIARSLRPYEVKNISKPLWCPYLGRELTEEEKKWLEIRKKLK